jgi:hypothetical protein
MDERDALVKVLRDSAAPRIPRRRPAGVVTSVSASSGRDDVAVVHGGSDKVLLFLDKARFNTAHKLSASPWMKRFFSSTISMSSKRVRACPRGEQSRANRVRSHTKSTERSRESTLGTLGLPVVTSPSADASRSYTQKQAKSIGVTGFVTNASDGSVGCQRFHLMRGLTLHRSRARHRAAMRPSSSLSSI